jgi:hypothetical protein
MASLFKYDSTNSYRKLIKLNEIYWKINQVYIYNISIRRIIWGKILTDLFVAVVVR